MKFLKFLHAVNQSLNAFLRHSVVARCTETAYRTVSLNTHHTYLLAYDNGILKTFSADCIKNPRILYEETFKRNMNINVEELFKDSYGIWNQADIPVEEIELSYDALDGNFLKSVPLHHSQEILTDNEAEFRIRIRLRITNDFVMALLSRSRSLTVIKPLHLRERVRKVYEEALKRNA